VYPDEYFSDFHIHSTSFEDAQQKLDQVTPVLNEIVENFRHFKDTFNNLEQVSSHNGSVSEISQTRYQLDMYEEKLGILNRSLVEQNILLRDWELARIDFGSDINGRPIWLCYQPDEQQINHYHEFNFSCDWRKSIDFII